MRLFIVRHGKATDADACSNGDFGRELTPRGQTQARFLAGRLVKDGRPIGAIIASRYPRSLQTAHIIQQTMSCNLTTDVRLEVDHEVSEVLEIIQQHGQEKALMVVGHNPQLGELISVLCSGLPPQELILKTGEMVVIDVRPAQPVGSGKLVDRTRLCDSAPADDTISAMETIDSKSR